MTWLGDIWRLNVLLLYPAALLAVPGGVLGSVLLFRRGTVLRSAIPTSVSYSYSPSPLIMSRGCWTNSPGNSYARRHPFTGGSLRDSRSVLECGCALPLSFVCAALTPTKRTVHVQTLFIPPPQLRNQPHKPINPTAHPTNMMKRATSQCRLWDPLAIRVAPASTMIAELILCSRFGPSFTLMVPNISRLQSDRSQERDFAEELSAWLLSEKTTLQG